MTTHTPFRVADDSLINDCWFFRPSVDSRSARRRIVVFYSRGEHQIADAALHRAGGLIAKMPTSVNEGDFIAAVRELENELNLPSQLRGLLGNRQGQPRLSKLLRETYTPSRISGSQATWSRIAGFYFQYGRPHEALAIHTDLYEQILAAQELAKTRQHKGDALYWISCYHEAIGRPLIALRYLMLALVEDAITTEAAIQPERVGTYHKLVFSGRLPDAEYWRYAKEIDTIYKKGTREDETLRFYPEWLLQQLDNDWITRGPTADESGVFVASPAYIAHLIKHLGQGTGQALELLASYLLSCMPGCRTALRKQTPSSEHDIVCSMEGPDLDFRSELGRYFVCQCKDWTHSKADFTTMATLCRVLDSVKARFGILFSPSGSSGTGKLRYAEREQLKVFHDRGIVVVIVDREDLDRVATGANFISLLRSKYETVRLDLLGEDHVTNS